MSKVDKLLMAYEKRDAKLWARVPRKLKEIIEQTAKCAGRSKSAEVTVRLVKSLKNYEHIGKIQEFLAGEKKHEK